MDIAALSIMMNQSKVQQSAGIAVMKMAMNNSSETAERVTEMLDNNSSNPNLGSNFDIKA